MSRRTGRALLSLAIDPKTPKDAQRLTRALRQLAAEDPDLHVRGGDCGVRPVIASDSEEHLERIVERLARDFHVEASLGRPAVAYKETLTRAADGEMKYIRQTVGHSEYAHVKIRVSPGEPGTGNVLDNDIVGGAIPDEYITSVTDGIKAALSRGVLSGHPLDDVRIVLCDGSYHERDSSEAAFAIAGSMALQDAAQKAHPVLLEPMMRVEVIVPKDRSADVIAALSRRGGQIGLQDDRGGTRIIVARVRLSQMFGYAAELRSQTSVRGSHTIQFEAYVPVLPPEKDGGDAVVGAPRRPAPNPRHLGVALPEPGENGITNQG